MIRRSLATGALVAAAFLCPPTLAQEDFVSSAPLWEAGLSKFWQLRLPFDPGQQITDVYLVDDSLYVGTQDGFVYALDAYTGVLRWLQQVTGSGYRVRRPCHVGDNVVFVTPVDVQTYNRRTGDGVNRSRLRFPPGTGAVTDGERLFIGGIDRRLYALDATTQFLDWRAITDGPIVSTPAIYGPYVFTANDGGTVYACTREKKALLWPTPAVTYGPITADLVVNKQGIFAASRDLSLYLFDLDHGQVRWRARFPQQLNEAPVVTDDLAFQYCEGYGLAAVETAQLDVTERIRWKLAEGRRALASDDKFAYVLSNAETLLVVSRKNGEIAHTIPVPGFTFGVPAIETTTVFLAAPDGRLFCARPRSAKPLSKADLMAALLSKPGQEATSQPTVATATSQPAAGPAEAAAAEPQGMPLGGTSEVSKEFEERARSR